MWKILICVFFVKSAIVSRKAYGGSFWFCFEIYRYWRKEKLALTERIPWPQNIWKPSQLINQGWDEGECNLCRSTPISSNGLIHQCVLFFSDEIAGPILVGISRRNSLLFFSYFIFHCNIEICHSAHLFHVDKVHHTNQHWLYSCTEWFHWIALK